ncbi:MAG TPA: Ig-like domain-containing protein, partial [Methylomirabilota bacterium]|nr:Ig-like domain-containing protein [Methylomirabilota bacterium]
SNTLVLINGVGSGTAGADIIVNANASIQSLGTELHPVTITCSNVFMANRWGQIRHNSSLPSLYRHTFINRAGRAPGEGHTGQGPVIRPDGTTLTFESCTISDLCETSPGAPGFGTPGKVMFANNSVLAFDDCLLQRVRTGPEIQGTAILFTNSYVMDTRGPDDSDGIYLHAQQPGQIIKLVDSVFALGDDDGIDTLGSTIFLENCIFRDWASTVEDAKAISIFDGAADVKRCLIVDSTVGIAAKTGAGSSARVTINNSTLFGNLTNVLAQFKANAPGPVIDYRITNCVIWGGDPVQSDFAATNFTIRYSNVGEPWAGTGNINSDPDFVNVAAKNFRLQITSPCIDAGNPASPLDADGTIADMGSFPFLSNPDPLVAFGSIWRYLDTGSNQGTTWVGRLFDDSLWFFGPAQFGYGDGDETTVVGFGPDAGNKYITTHFRHAFTVLNPSEFTNLQARLLVDDGAVVYLNGAEVYRVNMAPGPVDYVTLASVVVGDNEEFVNAISPLLLLVGTNVIAVEVHQQSVTSSDVSFDFELRGERGAGGNAAPNVTITAPANGSSFPVPANITINVAATDSDGAITTLLIFQNNTLLFETNNGPASFLWQGVPAGNYTLRAVATDDSVATSTSAPVNITVSEPSSTFTNDFITFGSSWKYHDKGSNLLTAWVQPAYDDSTWSNGLAQLGYGDGDEVTVVEDNSTPGYNPAEGGRFITTYFRKSFNVVNAAAFTNLSLRLLRDDGGIVYLNGTEIFRTVNMPAGAASYLTTTLQPNGENTIDTANFAVSGLLNEGANMLAVEIHQQGPTSSDVSFDFALTGVRPGETNARPIVSISSPAGGTIFGTPASFTVTANAFDPDGTITNVAFYVNGSKSGDDTSSPFTLTTNNVPVGAYSLVAVATDNVGLITTSSIVNVTVSANIAPPVVFNKTPAPGSVTTLTNIMVTFSKAVTGVSASDLLLNGSPATGVSGSGSNYTFIFSPPPFGTVAITWASAHGITDLFTPSHAFTTNSAGANWQYQFLDAVAPTMTTINPVPNSTVPALTSIAVTFSESVTGVNASDLLINSTPASGLAGSGAGPYSFTFAAPTQGVVQVSWAGAHGIQDSAANAFAPTPWSYILDTNSVGIVISEIMYHPSSENVLEEYIEMFNKGAGTIGLNGWQLTKGVSFTFPNVSLAPGGYLVVAANVAAFTAKYPGVANVVGGWTGVLNNTGEEIEIANASGEAVNSVEYADEGEWAIRQRGFNDQGYRGWSWYNPHDGLGNSLELINPNADNNRGQNWAASGSANGTPGRVNSVNTNNIAPFILDVTHVPTVPRSPDSIVISARVLDEAAGGMAVNLFWRVDSAAPPPFTNVVMHDDGVNGDAAANDGIYTTRLLPQANNSIIEFYVRAMDVQGLVRTWPGPAIGSSDGGVGPTGQVANALFQIDDSVYSTTNAQPLYKVIMTAVENTELAATACSGSSDALMNATLITIDGGGVGHHYLVGVRPRGHSTRCAGNRRINFRSDDLWKGLTAVNFNAVNVPAQHFGSVLARRSGAAGPAAYVAQVRFNNVNRLSGPYAVVEEMNQDFADARFPLDSGGNIYRVLRDFGPNFDYRGTDPVSYMNTYYKQNNLSENDWSDLIGMLDVMGIGNTVPFTT